MSALAQPLTTQEIHTANLAKLERYKAVAHFADPGMEQLRVNAVAVATQQAGYSGAALARMGPKLRPILGVACALSMLQMVNVRNPEGDVINVVEAIDLLEAQPIPQAEV